MSLFRPKYKNGDRSPIYSYEFMVNGQRYKGSTHETSKELAREVEQEKRQQARSGRHGKQITPVPFAVLADQYIKLHVEPNIKRPDFYRVIVRRLREKFGKRPVPTITQLDCAGVMAERRRSSANNSTYNATVTVLKHIFEKAIEYGYLAEGANPARKVDFKKQPPPRDRAPSADDIAAIAAECPPWLRQVVEFAFLTGARKNECLSLTWDDINFQLGRLTFTDTKDGSNRHFFFGDRVRGFLKSLSDRRPGSARVFHRDGGPIGESVLGKYFRRARGRAALDWVRFHDLRVGWATACGAAGMPARTLMELGGWSSLEMVLRYVKNSAGSRQAGIDAMDRAFGQRSPESPTVDPQIVEFTPKLAANR